MLKKNQKNFAYLLVLIIPLFFLFTRSNLFTPFRTTVVEITSIPLHMISWTLFEIKKMVYYHRTFEEYKRFKNDNENLKSRLMGMDQVILENTRLAKLLDFKRDLVYASVAAVVIGRDPSSWSSSMIINKGAKDGIRQGMPVISLLGVVGKVTEVYQKNSKIILLTDPQFSVAAIIQETRESGLITGTLQGDVCRLRYINQDSEIKIGQKIVTAKLSSSFPENVLIGEIIRIERNPQGQSLECIVKPAVSLSRIEEVIVILK